MSTYRCPLCGAGHKDQAERCRLCGQSLNPDAVARTATPVATPARSARGIKGLVAIGLALVLAVLTTALVFGLTRDNGPVQKAKGLVEDEADGWTTQADGDGGFQVVLPGVRTREQRDHPAPDDQRVTAWTAELGTDAEVLVGWGRVAPPATGDDLDPPAARRYLRETVLPRWMSAAGLTQPTVDIADDTVGGLPAVTARTTLPRFRVAGRDAYGYVTLALNDTTLYVLQVTSVYPDAPQPARLADSFTVTGPAV